MRVTRKTARAPHQLPAGRHGIPRELVAQNQRERIVAAVADVSSVVGAGAMSVEDIIRTAGVSRRTFYDHFKSKEEAFLAAFDEAVDALTEAVATAAAVPGTPVERVARSIGALMDQLAADPARTEMCVVEVLAAGPEARDHRQAAVRHIAELVTAAADLRATESAPPGSPSRWLLAETIVGGISEVIHSRVVRGEVEQLPELVPDLTYSIFLPFRGVEAALEARNVAASLAPHAVAEAS